MKVPFLPKAGIAAAALELREKAFGDRVHAIPLDLDALVFDYLCEKQGLVFTDESHLGFIDGDEVLGRTDLLAGRISITSTIKHTDLRRYRFTVAHEIGHWVFHRPLALANREHPELFPEGAILVTTTATLAPLGASSRDNTSVEWQANYFASHILLPRRVLASEFALRFGPKPLVRDRSETLRDLARRAARSRTDGSSSLADAFGTSTEATAIALEEAGLVAADPVLF